MANYEFCQYDDRGRWTSYWHQINEVLELKPESVLEVGVGNRTVSGCLKKHGLNVRILDVDKDRKPDIIGSVEEMPFQNDFFDLILCAEVLEHLPFGKFEKCLGELKRVSRKNVVLSLPHFGPPIKISFKIPFIREIRIAFKIPYRPKHKSGGVHHWEIGKRGYPPNKIRDIIKRYFRIKKEFIPFENQYHHFYILEK